MGNYCDGRCTLAINKKKLDGDQSKLLDAFRNNEKYADKYWIGCYDNEKLDENAKAYLKEAIPKKYWDCQTFVTRMRWEHSTEDYIDFPLLTTHIEVFSYEDKPDCLCIEMTWSSKHFYADDLEELFKIFDSCLDEDYYLDSENPILVVGRISDEDGNEKNNKYYAYSKDRTPHIYSPDEIARKEVEQKYSVDYRTANVIAQIDEYFNNDIFIILDRYKDFFRE